MNDNLNLRSGWTLRNVILTAISDRGPVYNERGLSLRLSEGRHEQLFPSGPGEELKEVWEYQLSFCLLDARDPENASQVESMIALVGELEDGRQCKVHGAGWIGRDNLEQIEGTFFTPPRIELADAEDDLLDPNWREAE